MPTYRYRCKTCKFEFEAIQSMMDHPIQACKKSTCNGQVFRIIHPANIQFKGTGFYINDSKQSSKTTADSTNTNSPTSNDSTQSNSTDTNNSSNQSSKTDPTSSTNETTSKSTAPSPNKTTAPQTTTTQSST